MYCTAQVAGENALLARVLLTAVATLAKGLGGRLTVNGRLLRVVLLPMLERLADPNPSVSASAQASQRLTLVRGFS